MAYLTVADYIARFGAYETGLFTNSENPAEGDPGYDAPKVEAAIDDATEEVEAYIAPRYATPLTPPPPIVKGWVAAVARLKLAEATGRVSDAIKDAAARVTRQLEQLAAGKINLPIEGGGTAPVQVGAGEAVSTRDGLGTVFGGHALDGFTSPFTGGGAYDPCWRRPG